MNELLPVSARRTSYGRLEIGGCDVVELADTWGTPLYLYDQETLDQGVIAYRTALDSNWPGSYEVAYAAKAWLSLALARWARSRGLGMDVVSEGELRHALRGGFPPERIHAHGNNKSDAFLELCVNEQVGRVVLDHPREAERLIGICSRLGQRQSVWVRLNPAVNTGTHASIETGSATSKFGLTLDDLPLATLAHVLLEAEWLDWKGVHFHIGSQIATIEPFVQAVHHVLDWVAAMRARYGWYPQELSPGGGWAVPYIPNAPVLKPADAIPALANAIARGCQERALPLPLLVLEPGRELVGRAGVALYRVGAVKPVSGQTYLFLDGGLADNPRPALYDAPYSALKVDEDMGDGVLKCYTLAGPFCESGDILARELRLPTIREGDLLAVPVSGAYQLSMASQYNGTPRPAVVWLRNGSAHLIRPRETYADLWRGETLPGGLS